MKLLILFVCVCVVSAAKKRFEGDQVLTLHPRAPAHLRLIKEFGSIDGLADFWSPESADQARVGHPVDVRFPMKFLRVVKKKLEKLHIDYEIKIFDLQKLIDVQVNPLEIPISYYETYHTYDEINQWTSDIAADYPNLVTRNVMGQSWEGRDITMLTLSTSSTNPIFLIDCGIHAREWISPAVCQCFVDRMLSGYGIDTGVTEILNAVTFAVIPVLNVDGYSFSHTNDRMWRKTRSNYGTVCTGVDPNRNFDAGWSGPGASSNPCSETYYGPIVESEPLSQHLSNYIRNNIHQIDAYVTFHSYGQVYIFPYSYTETKDPSNKDELMYLAEASTAQLQTVNKKIFDFGEGHEVFYLAAGGSDDFAYDAGVPISYTIELRDQGRYGFILPENQIFDSCMEIFPAVDVISRHIMSYYSK